MTKKLKALTSIDEMVSNAHRGSAAESLTVKVATELVFKVTPARKRELDDAQKFAADRLYAEE